MGAQSVAAVVTATVPEPCTTFSRPEMTKGMRMKGRPVFSTICARLSPAPETLSTWPSAPPAAVMNTMGPASFRVLSMMSMMALPPRRLPRVMMDRTAPMARAMLESPTKETMDRMGESSGKTTLALHILAQAQKKGGEVAFVDAEHALDPTYARALGVKIEDMLISQPDTGEQALEITEALVRSGAIDVVVVDSVAALVPRAEIEGEMGDSFVGLHARLMSQALRKLTGVIAKTNTVVIFINQLREKVGVMYGNPEVTTGGRALKFYASVRIDVRRVETLKAGGEMIGNRTRAKVVKNKVAPPFREAEFDIMYGEGISRTGEILDLGVKLDLIQKSGSWFSMGEVRMGQGRDAAKQYLTDHPDVCDALEEDIRRNFHKLMSNQSKVAARAAGRAVDVAADDFDDAD